MSWGNAASAATTTATTADAAADTLELGLLPACANNLFNIVSMEAL